MDLRSLSWTPLDMSEWRPHEELVTMLPRRLSDGIDEMLKKFDLDRPEVREQPPRNIFLAQD